MNGNGVWTKIKDYDKNNGTGPMYGYFVDGILVGGYEDAGGSMYSVTLLQFQSVFKHKELHMRTIKEAKQYVETNYLKEDKESPYMRDVMIQTRVGYR